jgi:hypothetical protein
MVRLTADLLLAAPVRFNPADDRELVLRGAWPGGDDALDVDLAGSAMPAQAVALALTVPGHMPPYPPRLQA